VGADDIKKSMKHARGCNKSSAYPSTREAEEASYDIFVFCEARYFLRILFGGSFNVPRKKKTTIKYVIEKETE
jgi:hypothetical protein